MRKGHIKKGSIAVSILILILILVGSLFAFKDIFTKSPDDNPVELNKDDTTKHSLSIAMVGDVLLHDVVYQDAMVQVNKYDFDYMFKDVKPLLSGYDLKFYNQESIIGGKALGLSTYPRFNSPEEIGDSMVNLGFNMVSLANNHTLDRGEKAITNSINYWKTKNVMTAGSYLSEEDRVKDNIKEVNGITYTLLSYTTTTNGLKAPTGKDYLVDVYDANKVKADVERVRNKVDLVIVSIHWGDEYSNDISSNQQEIANYLASLGVDIVIGHHPHVIQPIQKIDNTLVFYSLGNFLSGQDTADTLTGLIASLNVTVEKSNNEKTVSFGPIKADLVYTYSKNSSNFDIIPYTELTASELPSYKTVYDKYTGIIKSLDNNVTVSKIGDK